jgi:DNA repair exonuclease SbcCD ATPase subunit
MKLDFNNLTFDNFKSFNGHHTFEFDRAPGLYLVMGDNRASPRLGANGAGKSSLWDALVWALENRTVRATRPGAAIVPWVGGAPRVEVGVSRDGIRHSVMRRRNPNQLLLDERPVETDDVERLIGVSGSILRRSVIMGQFGETFLDLRPEQKSQMLSDVLGLDRWLKAAERARKAYTIDEGAAVQQQGALAALAQRIADHDEQLTQARQLARTEAQARQNALADAESKLAQVRTRHRQAQQEARAAVAKVVVCARATAPLGPRDLEGVSELLRSTASKASKAAIMAKAKLMADRKRLSEYNQTPGKCPECGQAVRATHAAQRIKALEVSVAALEADVEEHEAVASETTSRLNQLQPPLRALEIAATEVTNAQAVVEQAQASKSSVGAVVHTLESKIKTLKAQVPAIERAIVDLQATAEAARYWVEGFKEIRLHRLESVLADIEFASNRIALGLGLDGWSIGFQTERITQAGSVVSGFNTVLFPPGQDAPEPWESYSGGESQRWRLASTFALSEVLLAHVGIEPNIEILDEPLQHLSEQGVSDVLEYLRERAQMLGRAIYLTEHRILDAGAFDGCLTVVKDYTGSFVV